MKRVAGFLACVAVLAGGQAARAADRQALQKLQAPPAAASVIPLTAGSTVQAVKFARVVVQLRPEPWAVIKVDSHSDQGAIVYAEERLVTWDQGQKDVDVSAVSLIFDEELRNAGFKADGGGESVFSDDGRANLQVGVKITDMRGRFCRYCGFGAGSWAGNWTGAVVMAGRWEVYSNLDRRVVATIDTEGGYQAPKGGLSGDPDRLVNEAFRDNVRRLLATDEFRRIVTTPLGAAPSVSAQPIIVLRGVAMGLGVPQASKSVAIVYAAEGAGSGFLVSSDGYLLTNRHVVGASKYVKLKWADGSEALGEVIRSDPRRDVALIKADAVGRAPLVLRHTAVQQGETVFAIGTPLEDRLQNTMTKGIVSATRVYDGLSFIQSDVGVTHGNSGGPLIDEKGAVIGLTVMGVHPEESKSLNLFIPIDDALRALALKPAA